MYLESHPWNVCHCAMYLRSALGQLTIPVFFMPFTSPLAGKWFDCYGPHLPITIGSGLHVFGLLMASLSHKYYQFTLSQSVMSEIGSSLIFIPAMSAVSFKRTNLR